MSPEPVFNNIGYQTLGSVSSSGRHDDVMKWNHFPRYRHFVRGIHQSPVNFPPKGALMFSLICAWTNGWVNNRDACNLRRHRTDYDVTVMNVRQGYFCLGFILYGTFLPYLRLYLKSIHSSFENECRYTCIARISDFNYTKFVILSPY